MLPQNLILVASGCALQCGIGRESQPAILTVACNALGAVHDCTALHLMHCMTCEVVVQASYRGQDSLLLFSICLKF